MTSRSRSMFITMMSLVLLSVPELQAQYYEPSVYEQAEARYANVGFMQRDFQPLSSNPVADSLAIGFNRIMPMIGLRQGPVDVVFGYTRFTLRGERREAILFAARFTNDIPVAGTKPGALIIPLVIGTDYSKAQAVGPERETFNIVSVGIGGGLKYRYYTRSVDFSIAATEIFHYAFEGFNTGSGFSAATVGEASVLFPGALALDGIALGYRFRYQIWSMSEQRFNYRSLSHGPYLGIMF
ncbi:MAG: hypothetical protein ACKVRP_14770 [Bacteroidota bacterium]